MKRFFLLLMASSILFASCSSSKKTVQSSSTSTSTAKSGDGSSFENAIVINETSEGKGVSAEYAWLKEHYRGYKNKGQKLSFHQKKTIRHNNH